MNNEEVLLDGWFYKKSQKDFSNEDLDGPFIPNGFCFGIRRFNKKDLVVSETQKRYISFWHPEEVQAVFDVKKGLLIPMFVMTQKVNKLGLLVCK
jgi:hypothetical protein